MEYCNLFAWISKRALAGQWPVDDRGRWRARCWSGRCWRARCWSGRCWRAMRSLANTDKFGDRSLILRPYHNRYYYINVIILLLLFRYYYSNSNYFQLHLLINIYLCLALMMKLLVFIAMVMCVRADETILPSHSFTCISE